MPDEAVPADPTPKKDLTSGTRGASPLARQRRAAVLDALRSAGASSVVDMGCGEGALLAELLDDVRFTRITGADVSARALQNANRRLGLTAQPDGRRSDYRISDHRRERITLLQSSLTYRDDRLRDHDAMVLMEVIEHVDPPRLEALQRNVFNAARPTTVIITTPNAEYNVRYPDLAKGTYRHRDHRFEWSREEFQDWAGRVSTTHGYTVQHSGIGNTDADLGAPTQLAVFSRASA